MQNYKSSNSYSGLPGFDHAMLHQKTCTTMPYMGMLTRVREKVCVFSVEPVDTHSLPQPLTGTVQAQLSQLMLQR